MTRLERNSRYSGGEFNILTPMPEYLLFDFTTLVIWTGMDNISFFNLSSTSNFDSMGKQSSVFINIPFSERSVTIPGINVLEKGNLKARFTGVRSKFLLYMIVTP